MSDVHARPLSEKQLAWRAGVIYVAALVVLGPAVALTASSAPVLTQLLLALGGSALVVVMAGLVGGLIGEVRRAVRGAAARRPQHEAQDQPTAMPQAA